MKYTVDGNTVDIPDDFLKEAKKKYGLTNKGCIELYLSGEGLIDKNQEDIVKTKSKKTRSRKPDETKQMIMRALANCLENEVDLTINVVNPERLISFVLDGEKFEVVLTKKRK